MIGVVDYGAGNLLSVTNALDALDVAWAHVGEPRALAECARIVLPGVGHFAAAAEQLVRSGLDDALRAAVEKGQPLFGVCLGAQLLFETSEEAPGVAGLGIIGGRVERLKTRTVPHMGWNRVTATRGGQLFEPAEEPAYFYFAHSFVCAPRAHADVAAEASCDDQTFCVAVERGNVLGVQFHPEKSGPAGLALLRRFATC